MRRITQGVVIAILLMAAFVVGYLVNRTASPKLPYAAPKHMLDGAVSVPGFTLPPSVYMSEAAVNLLKLRALVPGAAPDAAQDIAESRAEVTTLLSPVVATMQDKYPVAMEETSIAGVPVRIFTPKDRAADPERVLINLHGGAFSVCWESCSILESTPIAALGGFKVVSVNYRMAPEARHPAAVDDVIAVYRELSQQYSAKQIGIYGCSAGGMLTAQAAALIPRKRLATPGAIGIFGAGGVPMSTGDSAYVAAYIDGSFPPPPGAGEKQPDITRGYFADADTSGPIISPALHLDVLKSFPPALITTGTRAMDMSPAIFTNSQLIKAHVPSTLIVGEGMGHCYQYFADYPEAQAAYNATVDFFRAHLQE